VQHELLVFSWNNASVWVHDFVPKLIFNAIPYLFPKMMFDPFCWWMKVIDWQIRVPPKPRFP
jgi:hypothetical protein